MTTEERLEKLEKEVRLAKAASRSLAISFCICLALGVIQIVEMHLRLTSQSNSIRTRSIDVVDETGRSFIRLFAVEGHPQMSLNGKDGKSAISLTVQTIGPSITISDNKLNAFLTPHQLYLTEGNGKPSAWLTPGDLTVITGLSSASLSADTGSALTMIGKHGSFWVDTDRDGETSMKMMDKRYTVRSSLGIGSGEKSGMVLTDEKGQRLWSLP